MKSKIILIFAVSIIIIAGGRYDGYTQVSVTIPDIQTQQGARIKVPVLVSDLSDYAIISYQFKVVYDSMVMIAQGVSAESTLTAFWGNPAANIDTSGLMIVGVFGVKALSQGGVLINLVFDIHADYGDSSAISLEYFFFNGGNPQVTIKNGSVKVLAPTAIGRINSEIPRGVQFVSNYPDPFQTRTSIVIKNSGQDAVRISIFNLLGQRIKQMGMFHQKPGDLKLEWDATNERGMRVPAGVYFCVVQNNEKIIGVKRMILIE